jgi:bacterioferritin
LDIADIRRRAREHMGRGAVTAAYAADRARVVQVLNDALATEIVCTLRYRNHYFMAHGVHGEAVAGELLEHAQQEQAHADAIAERIVQLGGAPDMDPGRIALRAHSEYREAETLRQMLEEDLVAERIAIETYTEIIRWLGDDDPTTRRMLENILENEEEHAHDLAELLEEADRAVPQ